MAGSDKRKQSLYFPEDMLKEIQEEATRQDRSLSWIVQKAWKIARTEIRKYPSVNEFPGEEDSKLPSFLVARDGDYLSLDEVRTDSRTGGIHHSWEALLAAVAGRAGRVDLLAAVPVPGRLAGAVTDFGH